jgi:hypothetical protein
MLILWITIMIVCVPVRQPLTTQTPGPMTYGNERNPPNRMCTSTTDGHNRGSPRKYRHGSYIKITTWFFSRENGSRNTQKDDEQTRHTRHRIGRTAHPRMAGATRNAQSRGRTWIGVDPIRYKSEGPRQSALPRQFRSITHLGRTLGKIPRPSILSMNFRVPSIFFFKKNVFFFFFSTYTNHPRRSP